MNSKLARVRSRRGPFLFSYLAVDHSPATEHLVVGVLLHGRPAKSQTEIDQPRDWKTEQTKPNHAYGNGTISKQNKTIMSHAW
jgi:hypothetical protein